MTNNTDLSPIEVTLSPARNILTRACQWIDPEYGLGDACGQAAVADAYIPKYSTWGYLCLAHLESHGPLSKSYVTNITSPPLTFKLRTK